MTYKIGHLIIFTCGQKEQEESRQTMPQYPGVPAWNENKCTFLTHGTKRGRYFKCESRSEFVYCSPGSWLVATVASGETFSTFPRLSEDSGEAEAGAGSRGSFCDKLWQGGDGAQGGLDLQYQAPPRSGVTVIVCR